MKTQGISKASLEKVKITKVTLKTIYGGPSRRAELDHVGGGSGSGGSGGGPSSDDPGPDID